MANDQGYNIYGVVASTISIVGAIISLWLWLLYCRLPRSKIQLLECLLSETEKLLYTAIKDGYIDDKSVHRFCNCLHNIKGSADIVRAEVYSTRTTWQDIKKWWNGLSLKMSKICEELQQLRTEISERCSDTAGGSKKEDTAVFKTDFEPLSSQRDSSSLSSVEKLPLDTEFATSLVPAPVIIPADVIHAGECAEDSPPPRLEDHHRMRAERRRTTRQILLRLGRELAAGSGLSRDPELCDAAHDAQTLPNAKRCGHRPVLQMATKFFPRALDPRLQSHACCDGPLVIELTPELLLDALEASDSGDSSDDEGDGGEEDSCDLGIAKLSV